MNFRALLPNHTKALLVRARLRSTKVYRFFLNTLYNIGLKKLAIHIADSWRWLAVKSPSRYDAAWEIAQRQTIYPCCAYGYCQWPVVPCNPHGDCVHELTHFMCDCGKELHISWRGHHKHYCFHCDTWFPESLENHQRLCEEYQMSGDAHYAHYNSGGGADAR
jgi:hypothetical protein